MIRVLFLYVESLQHTLPLCAKIAIFFSEYKETVLGECVLEQKSFVLLNSNGYKTIICLFRFIQKATKNIQKKTIVDN